MKNNSYESNVGIKPLIIELKENQNKYLAIIIEVIRYLDWFFKLLIFSGPLLYESPVEIVYKGACPNYFWKN